MTTMRSQHDGLRWNVMRPSLHVLVLAMSFAGACASTESGGFFSGPEIWMTWEDAVALAGPPPADHEALIRAWFESALHVSRPQETLSIGPLKPASYVEPHGLSGASEGKWWGWAAPVRGVPAAAAASAAGGSETYFVYMRDGGVVFTLAPDGSAFTAAGTRVEPFAPIPGVLP